MYDLAGAIVANQNREAARLDGCPPPLPCVLPFPSLPPTITQLANHLKYFFLCRYAKQTPHRPFFFFHFLDDVIAGVRNHPVPWRPFAHLA
jgi:hypothetical protein